METLPTLRKLCDQAVQARRPLQAQRGIAELLNRSRDPEDLFRACDWLRRLGAFRAAYKLLKLRKEEFASSASSSTLRGRRLIWGARLLNLMGASELALSIIQRVRPHDWEGHRICGNIYSTNFLHAQALREFEQMCAADPDPTRYGARVSRISLADSAAALGNWERAHAEIQGVLTASPEASLRSIALAARGEYLLRQKNTPEGLNALGEARTLLPAQDESPDAGILEKWLGYGWGLRGDVTRARQHFARAKKILSRNESRAEAWLDILRLENELGLTTPEEKQALATYPGLTPQFRKKLDASGQLPHLPTPPPRHLWILPDADEYGDGPQACLGIPLELKLLAWVHLAHPWGLPIERAKSVLWPDEPFSFPSMEGRISQLLRRLRSTRGISVQVQDRVLRLSNAQAARVTVFANSVPTFLAGQTEFTAQTFGQYYRLSPTQHRVWLEKLIQRGRIQAQRHGKQIHYRPC